MTKYKALVILGNSGSGKDTLARKLSENRPTVNLKFAQFAKDWVDSIYGGSYEKDRDTDLGGFTKREILIRLYHLFAEVDPSASVTATERRLGDLSQFAETLPIFTDVRSLAEVDWIVRSFDVRVVFLLGGTQLSSDRLLPKIVSRFGSVPLLVTKTDWLKLSDVDELLA